MSIVYEYHWTPETIKNMYVDDNDFEGLLYWYSELVRINKIRKNT